MAGKITKAILKIAPESIGNVIQAYRVKKFKQTAPRITKERIIKDIKKIGIRQGDVINLHSALKSIGYVEGGPKTVIDAIQEVITSSGTLMVPTFSLQTTIYKTCMDNEYVFDPRKDGTILGAIPSTFLELQGVQRSIHPTHSVSAIGKHAKYITEAHHMGGSIFGPDSPWGRLLKLDGKIFILGFKMGRNTISHVVEERKDFPVPSIMKKTYYLKCKDWNGNLIEVPVRPFNPKLNRTRIDHADGQYLKDYFWEEFSLAGILTIGKVGQAIAWIASANKYIDHLVKLMKEGITIYSTKSELKKRPLSYQDPVKS